MSKYTTELRYICESLAGLTESSPYSDTDSIISQAVNLLFDINIPTLNNVGVFNMKTEYPQLCKKILYHYYMREIGAETVGLWRLYLKSKLLEIMPYYHNLYQSIDLNYDILNDTDLTITEDNNDNYTGTSGDVINDNSQTTTNGGNNASSISSGETNSNSETKQLFSDTPQGGLTGIEAEKYLTNATLNSGNDKNTNKSNSSTEGTYQENKINKSIIEKKNTKQYNNDENKNKRIIGKQGNKSYAQLVQEHRDSIINIDTMVINDLEELFMLIW